MPTQDPQFWRKARRARAKLEKQYIHHPDVSLIDIGYAPKQSQVGETMALRIHVRKGWMQTPTQDRVSFPADIDDIPVVVILVDYDLSHDTPIVDE